MARFQLVVQLVANYLILNPNQGEWGGGGGNFTPPVGFSLITQKR